MTLFERMYQTRFGRLISSIFIYGLIFFIILLVLSLSGDSLDIVEEPLSFFAIFGLAALLLIQIIFDLFGFIEATGIFEGFLAIIRGILFIVGGLAIIFFIYVAVSSLFDGAIKNELALVDSDIMGFAFYTACPFGVGLCFLLSTWFIEDHEEFIPLLGIGSYIVGIIVGIIFAIIGVSNDSVFLAYWLPFILSCILFVIGVVIIFTNGFPETYSEGIEFLEFFIILATPFIWLFKGIWFVLKYIGIFFIWLFGLIVDFITELRDRPRPVKVKKKKKPKKIKEPKQKKSPAKEYKERTVQMVDEPNYDVSRYVSRLSGKLGFFIKNCFGWHFYGGESETIVSQRNALTDVKNIFVKTFYFRRASYYSDNVIFDITELISNLLDYIRFYIEAFWEIVLVGIVVSFSFGLVFIPMIFLGIYGLIILVALIGRLERKIFKIDAYMQAYNDILIGGDGEMEFDTKYTFKGVFGFIDKAFHQCFGFVSNFQFELDAIEFGSNAAEMRKELTRVSYEIEHTTNEYGDDCNNIVDVNRNDYNFQKGLYNDQLKSGYLSYEEYTRKIDALDYDTKHKLRSALDDRTNKFDEDMSNIGSTKEGRIYKRGTITVSRITQLIRPKYYTTNILFYLNEKIANLIYPFLFPILLLAVIFYFMEKSFEFAVLFGVCAAIVIISCCVSLLIRKIKKIDQDAWTLKTKEEIEEKEAKHREKLEERNKVTVLDIVLMCLPIVNLIYIMVVAVLALIRVYPFRKYFKLLLIGYVPMCISGLLILYLMYTVFGNIFM